MSEVGVRAERERTGAGRTKGVGGIKGAEADGCMNWRGLKSEVAGAVTVVEEVVVEVVVVEVDFAAFEGRGDVGLVVDAQLHVDGGMLLAALDG